jgi:hypothetical protein
VTSRDIVIALRVGGFLIAGVGVSFLDTGFGVNFANLDRSAKTAIALIGIGVAAELLSFVVPAGENHLDDDY